MNILQAYIDLRVVKNQYPKNFSDDFECNNLLDCEDCYGANACQFISSLSSDIWVGNYINHVKPHITLYENYSLDELKFKFPELFL